MIASLNWIAGALGCIGLAASVAYWRIAQKTRRHLQQAQSDLQAAGDELKEMRLHLQQAQSDLQAVNNQLEETRRRAQELLDTPPLPRDAQLGGHLATLGARLIDCILNLEEARIQSASPLCRAAEEAEQSQTVSRRARFARFRDTLETANTQIGLHIERLLVSHPLTLALAEALRSGYLDARAGHSDIADIVAVLDALENEASPDDVWRDAIHAIRKEFDPIQNARARGREIERRLSEEARIAAEIAFNKYKLPPLTPLEKFRGLKSKGQRDSFG